jgi:cell division transport system permease protein
LEQIKKYKKKKKLGSYPYINVIFSITLALFVIGLFGILFLHTSTLTKIIRENVEIQVYLNKNTSENQRIKLRQTLATKPYVLTKDDQPAIVFVSKEDAARIFVNETGENFSEFLGDNPLRDAFTIHIDPVYFETNELSTIREDIEVMSGVFEVVYIESMINSINRNLTKISLVLFVLASILILVVVMLINNTIKLALFSQRFLIRSMQLVGAKPNFILKPFLLRSSMYGFIGGVLSAVGLYTIMNYAYREIEELKMLSDVNSTLILFAALLVLGILIGVFSTYRAISKYIKMSLDDLY